MLLEEFAGHLKDEAGVQALAVVRYPFLIFYAIDNTTDDRHPACPAQRAGTAIIVADRVQGAPLLRRCDPSRSDVTRRIAEALGHHRGQVLGLAGDAGAGAHGVAVLML